MPCCCPQVKGSDRQTSLLQWVLCRCLASSSGHVVARLPSELAACCRGAAVLPGAVAKQLQELQEGLEGLNAQVQALALQQGAEEADGAGGAERASGAETPSVQQQADAAGRAEPHTGVPGQQEGCTQQQEPLQVCSLSQHYEALARRHAQVLQHHARCLQGLAALAAWFGEEYDSSEPSRWAVGLLRVVCCRQHAMLRAAAG